MALSPAPSKMLTGDGALSSSAANRRECFRGDEVRTTPEQSTYETLQSLSASNEYLSLVFVTSPLDGVMTVTAY